MAEACRVGNQSNKERNTSATQDENFCVFNVLCVFISLVTILADLTTGACNLFKLVAVMIVHAKNILNSFKGSRRGVLFLHIPTYYQYIYGLYYSMIKLPSLQTLFLKIYLF